MPSFPLDIITCAHSPLLFKEAVHKFIVSDPGRYFVPLSKKYQTWYAKKAVTQHTNVTMSHVLPETILSSNLSRIPLLFTCIYSLWMYWCRISYLFWVKCCKVALWTASFKANTAAVQSNWSHAYPMQRNKINESILIMTIMPCTVAHVLQWAKEVVPRYIQISGYIIEYPIPGPEHQNIWRYRIDFWFWPLWVMWHLNYREYR